MSCKEALVYLNDWKTTKGNFKKEGVLKLLESLCNTQEKLKRVCPHCEGKGQVHYPCAFGGGGDWSECKVCSGIGKI